MSEQNKKLTFVIADIITHLAIAKLKSEVLSREPFVKGAARDAINRIGNRCNVAINEVRGLVSPASQKIMDEDILQSGVFLQIDLVTTAMYALPKGIRDEIESYVMSRYNIYSLNTKTEA